MKGLIRWTRLEKRVICMHTCATTERYVYIYISVCVCVCDSKLSAWHLQPLCHLRFKYSGTCSWTFCVFFFSVSKGWPGIPSWWGIFPRPPSKGSTFPVCSLEFFPWPSTCDVRCGAARLGALGFRSCKDLREILTTESFTSDLIDIR